MEIKKWKELNTRLIINNLELVFKTGNIDKLNGPTYKFLMNLAGFIAHYDINGFKVNYSDLRNLINDLKESSDVINPEYYLEDFFQNRPEQADYYKSKANALKLIKPLIEKYEESINKGFSVLERKEDLSQIKRLMRKNNLKEVKL